MNQFFFFLLCPFVLIGQTQIGQDIDGKDSYVDNLFGKSVAISSDGTIVAAGAPNNDDIHGKNSGQLRIYKNINGTWIQIGNDISGDVSGDSLGESVSLSSDGSIVAVGAPGNDGINGENSGHVRIYQNINDNWVQIGSDIDGAAAGDEFGYRLDLSSDGSVVAIGAENTEYVSIYENIGGTWTQIGSTIENEGNIWFRFSLSLSGDGNTLAIGAPYSNNENNIRSGVTRIYENIAGTWTQIGSDIYGEANRDLSGYSVDLSSNGSIIAIGARDNNGSVTSRGHVRVYENIGNTWTQIGNDIDAQIGDIQLGYSVSLSSDGSAVAIGAPLSSTNNYRSGLVRVYRYNGSLWNSVGSDINGEGKQDYSGESISLSSDGNTIVIGAPRNSGNGSNSGHIRVFENINDTWTQVGNDIDGDLGVSGDSLGQSVSVSSDGTILAIGAPGYDSAKGSVRIYENINGNWIQKGDDIIGEANHDLSGSSVSMSSNGNIVAIGAPRHDGINGFNSGYVRVFEFNNGNWTQIGSDIYGLSIIYNFGESISLSSDGNILAIANLIVYENINNNWVKLTEDLNEQSATLGARSVSLSSNGTIIAVGVPSDNTLAGGRVYIFENINGTWTQKGNDIIGEAEFDGSGSSLSFSSDGNILAIGAPFNDGTEEGSDTGHVRVYKYINNEWTQIGNDIDGETANYNFGLSLELSSDGSIVAIGSPFNNGNGPGSGLVRIYKNINDVWTQIGDDIDGEAAEDFSGSSVSLSADGKFVAIGSPYNDDNGLSSGHVRVYDLSAVLSTKSFEKDYFSFYPNPVQDILNINLNKGLELKQVNIYNLQSQYLYSVKTLKIDVSKLSSGIYFIEAVTDQGKSAKKIVIQ